MDGNQPRRMLGDSERIGELTYRSDLANTNLAKAEGRSR
jgi:hypothetical protein